MNLRHIVIYNECDLCMNKIDVDIPYVAINNDYAYMQMCMPCCKEFHLGIIRGLEKLKEQKCNDT